MHLFSSTATFILDSPLRKTTLYITHLNATAYHRDPSTGTEDQVGRILHDMPFAVPPGESETPRLPVAWSLGSVGYDAVKDAVGGSLRLNAKATVGVRIGKWQERIWFLGSGIGAKVRI
jgi:hypothetical protein